MQGDWGGRQRRKRMEHGEGWRWGNQLGGNRYTEIPPPLFASLQTRRRPPAYTAHFDFVHNSLLLLLHKSYTIRDVQSLML